MLSLDKKGTHLKYFSQKQDVILIKNLLVSVQHRWEKVVSKSAERTRALDYGYKEAKEFHDAWDFMMGWLDDGLIRLEEMSKEVKNDPEKIKQQIMRHKEFQKELGEKQPMYDSTMKTGKNLMGKAPKTDEPTIKNMMNDLKNKWNNLCNLSVERQKGFFKLPLSLNRQIAKVVPFVLQIIHHVLDGGFISLGSLTHQVLACFHGGVIHWLFLSKLLLELFVSHDLLFDLLRIILDLLRHFLQSDETIIQPSHHEVPSIMELLGLFVTIVKSSGSLSRLADNLLPSVLDRHQQVLDQDDVLLLREILQMSSLLVQGQHGFSLRGNFSLELLVLFNLHQDGFHHSGDWFQVSKSLLSIGQPINESLESFMELHGFLEGNFKLDLLVISSVHDVIPFGLQCFKIVGQVGSLTLL